MSINYFDGRADEHNIIATYCSKLSEFYAKNPNLYLNDPSTSSSELSQVNFSGANKKISSKSKNISVNSNEKGKSILNEKKSVSLHRNLSSIDKIKNTKITRSNAFNEKNEIMNQTNNEKNATRSLSETNFRLNKQYNKENDNLTVYENEKILMEKREIVSQLEQKNKEIIKEIEKLKLNNLSNKSKDSSEQFFYQSQKIKKNESKHTKFENSLQFSKPCIDNNISFDSGIVAELETLKQHKDHLENRMIQLENSRDELINRLTQLDSYIKPRNESEFNKIIELFDLR